MGLRMSLSDLASIGSFISGVAVLVSLIFLYFQLRQVNEQVKQAEKNQRTLIRSTRATRIIDIFLESSHPALADAVWLGNAASENMTDTQIHQFAQYATARFFNAEDSYYQYYNGVLDERAFESLTAGLRLGMSVPGSRAAYKKLRHNYGSEFVAYLDAILKEAESRSFTDDAASWRAAFAAERTSAGK